MTSMAIGKENAEEVLIMDRLRHAQAKRIQGSAAELQTWSVERGIKPIHYVQDIHQ